MAARAEFASYCSELLACAGPVQARRMFGGYGLYIEDVFVAIVAGENLFLKADAQTEQRFEAAGGRRFEYTAAGKRREAGFWTVPPEALESPRLMEPWARLALEAALRARTAPRRKR